jgi:ADYC domain
VGLWVFLLLELLAALVSPARGERAAGAPTLEVAGTLFQITMSDGRLLTSLDLIGAVLDAVDEAGHVTTVRIDAVTRDPSDPDGDLWLHRFSVPDSRRGGWGEFCSPGPDGTVAGFPIAGVWTSGGRHERPSSGFTITCTSGAVGKCVRIGYKPWREVRGESLWDFHQACVRAIRADYGGDGTGHTRDGTLVEISDRLGIQPPEPDPHWPALEFEAAWDPNGAVCVRRTRIPELLSIEELAQRYPRFAGKIGPICSDAVDALIWNRS